MLLEGSSLLIDIVAVFRSVISVSSEDTTKMIKRNTEGLGVGKKMLKVRWSGWDRYRLESPLWLPK